MSTVMTKESAQYLKRLQVEGENAADLAKVVSGKLSGFMKRAEVEAALAAKQEPIVISLPDEQACLYLIGDTITLADGSGKLTAIFQIQDKWIGEYLASQGTQVLDRGEVKKMRDKSSVYFGGPVTLL